MLSAYLASLCAALHQPLPAADQDGFFHIPFPEKFTLHCTKDRGHARMEMGIVPLPSSPQAREKLCRTVLEYSAARLSEEHGHPLLIPCLRGNELRLRLRFPLANGCEAFLEQSLRLYDTGVIWRGRMGKEGNLSLNYNKTNIPIVIFG